MNISAEWLVNKLKEKFYPITHAKVVIRGNSTVDNDLTVAENRLTALENKVPEVVEPTSGVLKGKVTETGNLIVPTDGWVLDSNINRYYLDIITDSEDIDSTTVPLLSIGYSGAAAAKACGFEKYCQTLEGTLRIFTVSVPSEPFEVGIVLLGKVNNQSEPISVDDLPMATTDTAGLVKIGDGLVVNDDGAVCLDTSKVVSTDSIINDDEFINTIRDLLKD